MQTEKDNFINMLTRANIDYKRELDEVKIGFQTGYESIWIEKEEIVTEFTFNPQGFLIGVYGYKK